MLDPDYYGTCAKIPCTCLRDKTRPWQGRACPNWKPVENAGEGDATAFREVLEKLSEEHGKMH